MDITLKPIFSKSIESYIAIFDVNGMINMVVRVETKSAGKGNKKCIQQRTLERMRPQ